jgi:hypothetical protein
MKKEKDRTTIMWIVITVLLLLVGYDAWACKDRNKRETISGMITHASETYLLIPLIFGLLAGHFFWSQHHLEDKHK